MQPLQGGRRQIRTCIHNSMYMAQAWFKHAEKSAKLPAVALQHMVPKTISRWLVNACVCQWIRHHAGARHLFALILDLSGLKKLSKNNRLMVPVAVSGRNRVSQCMVVEFWNIRQNRRQRVVDQSHVMAKNLKDMRQQITRQSKATPLQF